MPSLRQGALAVAAAVGLVLAGLLPSGAVAATSTVPTLDWKPCAEQFECATIPVPLDYRKPHGKRISIAMMRAPATDRDNRIGSLFILPGGPGLPGNDFLPTAPPGALAALGQFDVVTYDPRGTGASRPLFDCGQGFQVPPSFERAATIDRRAYEAKTRAYVKACQQKNALLMPHMSTANAARDVDLMRKAVGDDKLTALGISYGSAIAATYATMFPGRSRAMVISNPMDVQTYYDRPLDLWLEQSAGYETVLDRFFQGCLAAGPACGFGGDDPKVAFDNLLAKLDHAPLRGSDPADPVVNGDFVRQSAMSMTYGLSTWDGFAAALTRLEAGEADPMLDWYEETVGLLGFSFVNDAYTAVTAVDERWPRGPVSDYFDRRQLGEGLFDHFFFTVGHNELDAALWPAKDRNAFHGKIRNPKSAAPILVVGATYDSATPYVWSERLTADLGNARLLTFEADGHNAVLTGDFCLFVHVLTYLTDGKTLPPAGTVCVDQREPFSAGTR
ncbi:alpha/beta hydrolase [Tenggerimyces flavus]|uniref:Alpha/beta hydrolase n=1 Tax=Tenggerimyces flavus TaxID=1708749 RepID=A0ABV7YIF1_9ACTN|nr:alpha/beta hydrolase [Tenggerimyces flavus]MBM7783908.1 pimeloyl-ACP methyl ester carboxylesterase [Tenggerimyces flavus]